MSTNADHTSAMRRIKVLHVVLSIGETNATYNEHCLPMVDQREIAICTYFKPALPVPHSIKVFPGDGTLAGFIRVLRSTLRTNSFDVIHCHSPHVSLLLLVATWDRREDLLPISMVTVHDSYSNYKIRNRLLFLPVFAQFARIVCCSRSSFESFPFLYRWLAGQRLDAVQNGVHIARIDQVSATHQTQKTKERFNIVAIGRLVEIKNPFTALNAFRDTIDNCTYLTYLGEGPLRQQLMATCGSAGCDKQVTFTGLLPRDKVFGHMLSADLFISTSRGEGLPVAVLEAMACGCPVLLSDIPPHREIVENADFIPLIPPDDRSGFAHEISKFRSMPVSERIKIGDQCRELVEKKFSLQAMHTGYEGIYADLCKRSKVPVRLAAGGAHAG